MKNYFKEFDYSIHFIVDLLDIDEKIKTKLKGINMLMIPDI